MKRLVTLLFLLATLASFAQTQLDYKKLTVRDWIIYQGDTLAVWEDSLGNVYNRNTGGLIFSGQVFVPDIEAAGAKYDGYVAGIGIDDRLFPKSIVDLFNEQQDTLAKMGTPSPYATWVRDSSSYQLRPAFNSDKLRDVQTREKGQRAMVTFSFDDGNISDYTVMKPLFLAKGVPAATNIIPSLVGTAGYMTWAQIAELEADGWEICSHTQTHRRLTELNSDSIHWQLKTSLDTLRNRGFNVNNLAYPNNSFNDTVQYIARQYYRSARAAPAYTWPDHYEYWNDEILNTYHLSCVNAETQDSLEQYKRLVDTAEMYNRWLIFYTHSMTTADSLAWDTLIDYIQAKGIPIVTQNQALDSIGNQIDIHPGFAVHNDKMRLDGGLYKGNHLFMHNYEDTATYGYNTFVGARSGNETMGGTNDDGSYNTGFGYFTLPALTEGLGSTAIGAFSQYKNTTGQNNTSAGYFSAYELTTGASNVSIGGYSGEKNSTASNNTFIGSQSGRYATGGLNTYLGSGAGTGVDGSSTGTSNTGIGTSALSALTTGIGNATLGRESGKLLSTGNYNVLVGYLAGSSATAVGSTVNVGYDCGANSTGSNNTFVGAGAGKGGAGATSSYSTALGLNSLTSHTGALRTVAIGAYAGNSATSGDDNTFIGFSSGYNVTTGATNTMVGYRAGYKETGSHRSYWAADSTSWAVGMGSGSKLLWYADQSNAAKSAHFMNIFAKVSIGAAKDPTSMLEVTGNAVITGSLKSGTGAVADGDTTPDVSGYNTFIYAGSATASTTVTDLDNPVVGAYYTFIGNSDSYVLVFGGGNFKMTGSSPSLGVDDNITFYCLADNYYIEISRANNNP